MTAGPPSPARTTARRSLRRRGSFLPAAPLCAAQLCAGLALTDCAVDPARLPRTYLLQAQQAVKGRDAPAALAALDRAEAVWVSANTPFPTPFFGFDPEALRDIGSARVAVNMGRWGDADYYVRTAIAQPSVVRPGQPIPPGG